MRNLIIILVVVAVLYFGYKQANKVVDNFGFSTPQFVGADLRSIFSTTGFANADLQTTITNKNDFSVPVNNLYFEVYYNGSIVGKSTTPHDLFTIPANGSVTVAQNISIAVNDSIGIAAKMISGQKVTFEYKVKASLFGFYPLRNKGTFTY